MPRRLVPAFLRSSGGQSRCSSKMELPEQATLKDSQPDLASDDHKDFTEEELKDLRTAFCLLDRDRDGRVNASELQFMLRNMGIRVRDELLQELLSDASHSGSGLVDEAEFLQWVGRIQALTQDPGQSTADTSDDVAQDLVAAFRVFDRDCNGYITKDELKTAMDMIGEPVTELQLNEMLAIADIDKDGRINYEEFARLLS
ncbi:calcium-binding protein E63-1 isoform X1 [Bacillus rossius redtenbacheri]|uniref:calcium-binding protein E63-1 isoform X1 n=1 Tax=Bacillus rossius redtenbacheri TaxID=93214 RepID=UPI002FDE2900